MANKDLILTTDELKTYLGNTNASDSLIALHNQIAVNVLCDILKIANIITHNVENEEVEISMDRSVLIFNDFPVDLETIELSDKLVNRIDDDLSFRFASNSDQLVVLEDSVGRENMIPYKTGQVLANYSAGWEIASVPEDLKFACALIAGGGLSSAEKVGGVVEYRLGQKTVKFRDQGEAETARLIIEGYLTKYLPITVLS